MTPRYFRGKICSGKKEGAKYVGLPWVRRQIEEKLGFTPFPGTLNIRLSNREAARLRNALKSASATEIVPEAGFHRAQCYRISLTHSVECTIVAPIIEGYPANMVELVAECNLKERLGLKDGDTVRLRTP